MAHQRSDRKCGLAPLSTLARPHRLLLAIAAVLAATILGGCSQAPGPGWFAVSEARGEPEPVTELTLRDGEAITVRVELPAGYIPAEFLQRATMRRGGEEQTREQFAPESSSFSFRLTPAGGPGGPGGEASLTLVLGFCEPAAKDVCYVDMSEIPVRFTDTGPGAATVLYRPETPQ